jgi:hypothetical protein
LELKKGSDDPLADGARWFGHCQVPALSSIPTMFRAAQENR